MNDITANTSEYDRVVLLNRRISANVKAAQESLFEVCKDLKEIRDGRLYEALGYEAFEDFCTKEHELSYKQAMKYIAVAERFPDGISPGRIGISKLYLISTLSDEEKSEIEQRVDVEEVSKSQLEKAIAELKAENKRLEEEKQVSFDQLNKMHTKLSERRKEASFHREKAETLKEQLDASKQKLKELEGTAHRVDIAETNSKAYKARVEQLEAQIKELEVREPETVTVTDTTEIERLKAELAERTAVQTITETVEVKDDIDEFRAHYANALDSAARLISFVKQHADSRNFEFFEKKINALAEKIMNG